MMYKLNKKRLEESIFKFLNWLDLNGYSSYDRMDYWSSKTGILAKKIFYKNKLLGAPLAGWGLLLENFLPKLQKIYSEKKREVIGDSHLAMAFLNLYTIYNNKEYLTRAEEILKYIKSTSTDGYSGYAWGYTFGWQTQYGFWKPGIPLITITPYAFWAFLEHFKLTQNEESKKICISIADFALEDLNETKMSNGTYCSSYSPTTYDVVINANTYRASILLDAFMLTNKIKYKNAALKNINFVLSFQGKKGEWYYEAKPPKDNSIDNFHTVFVLRNLFKCYKILNEKRILNSIIKGYEYYRKNLFFDSGRPKYFSEPLYMKMRKHEMYDYAEGINLGCLINDIIPGSLKKSIWLANDLISNFQLKKGHFVTRVTTLNTFHKVPYIRWPQAQIFYALTQILKKID